MLAVLNNYSLQLQKLFLGQGADGAIRKGNKYFTAVLMLKRQEVGNCSYGFWIEEVCFEHVVIKISSSPELKSQTLISVTPST